MNIDVYPENGRCSVRIDGDLTIYSAAAVSETLREALATHPAIAIDLNNVTEIDTAGLQLLLMAKKEALLSDRKVSFIGHSRVVMDCLQLVNLANFFKLENAAATAA